MIRRRLVLLVLPVVALASCAVTPIMPQRVELCAYVRQSVKEGSMPLDLARAFYPECNATEAPR